MIGSALLWDHTGVAQSRVIASRRHMAKDDIREKRN
jgi:hypothetical protein